MKSVMPSPMEKGDRGAVDQGYPGMKENGEGQGRAILDSESWQEVLFPSLSFYRYTGIILIRFLRNHLPQRGRHYVFGLSHIACLR